MVCVNRCVVIVFLFLLVTFAFGESFFYFEPFSTDHPPGQQPAGWYGPEGTGTGAGFLYGRDGVYNFSERNSSVAYNGANVIFSGNLYTTATSGYLGTWVGSVIAYTNKLWTPTPYRPFGFEILRIEARIDPHREGPTGVTNPESRRMAASMSIYLAEYANINNSSPAGTKFANQVVLYDMMRMHDNLSNDSQTTPYSQWGYWLSSYSRLQVTNVSSLDGSTLNLKPILEWNMDDDWVHLTNEGSTIGGYSQYANPNSTNTNRMKIMVTHDGNVVQFFVNPDPANVNAYPNG
ncbi:MAG: hypothetical protein RMJ37_06115, partial [Spirochaetia bacterium]|nr:hypothetical protein [Spirochaetota bacterium]MDW8112888.1 hypothetical protein [Spirochaetia bacterium]